MKGLKGCRNNVKCVRLPLRHPHGILTQTRHVGSRVLRNALNAFRLIFRLHGSLDGDFGTTAHRFNVDATAGQFRRIELQNVGHRLFGRKRRHRNRQSFGQSGSSGIGKIRRKANQQDYRLQFLMNAEFDPHEPFLSLLDCRRMRQRPTVLNLPGIHYQSLAQRFRPRLGSRLPGRRPGIRRMSRN